MVSYLQNHGEMVKSQNHDMVIWYDVFNMSIWFGGEIVIFTIISK